MDVDASSEVLGHLAFRSPANLPGMSVVPFIAWATRPVRPAPGPEMTETFCVPLEDLPACEGEALETTAIGELHVPAFLWNGRVIWGFTYRVLGELLGLVGISR